MRRSATKPGSNNVIYSVRLRRGPDRVHYDMVFGETSIELRYLGEYWETSRPPTGMQKRQDLLIYSITKRKMRKGSSTSKRDIVIPYTAVKYATIKRKNAERGVLILTLKSGDTIEIEFSVKVYDIVKRLTRQKLGERMMRAR